MRRQLCLHCCNNAALRQCPACHDIVTDLFRFAPCRQRAARERMSALRTNDLEAYARLVHAAKSDRLTQLLGQTDACLGTLAARLQCSLRKAIPPAASLQRLPPGTAPEGMALCPSP